MTHPTPILCRCGGRVVVTDSGYRAEHLWIGHCERCGLQDIAGWPDAETAAREAGRFFERGKA